jgi:hypothetical protein
MEFIKSNYGSEIVKYINTGDMGSTDDTGSTDIANTVNVIKVIILHEKRYEFIISNNHIDGINMTDNTLIVNSSNDIAKIDTKLDNEVDRSYKDLCRPLPDILEEIQRSLIVKKGGSIQIEFLMDKELILWKYMNKSIYSLFENAGCEHIINYFMC